MQCIVVSSPCGCVDVMHGTRLNQYERQNSAEVGSVEQAVLEKTRDRVRYFVCAFMFESAVNAELFCAALDLIVH